jgi:hypothetical protein
MYIEFQLGTANDASAAQANMIINNALHEWSDRYEIPYNTKIIKYTKRITFDQDEHYSLFAMSWNPERKYPALGRWRIVSDLNNKTEFDSRV